MKIIEMSDFQKKAFERYISNNKLFLSLLSQKEMNDEAIKLMKMNFGMMRSALTDLGVVFDEQERIKELNQEIRRLEETQNNQEINYTSISTFVSNLSDHIRKILEDHGIHGVVNVNFGANLLVSVDLFSSDERPVDDLFYREDELETKNEKNLTRHRKMLSLYDCAKLNNHDYPDYILTYTEKNVNALIKVVEKAVGEDCGQYSVKIGTRYERTQGKTEKLHPKLDSISLTFITLSSSKSLLRAFNEYNK